MHARCRGLKAQTWPRRDAGRCCWPVTLAAKADTFTAVCREAEPRVLFQSESQYNDRVQVLEIPDHPLVDECISELRGSRIMILDGIGNIHSIWKPTALPSEYLTHSYWDFLATLPSLSPDGSIGVLGLAAGTVVRMIHAHYPERSLQAWELDPVVVIAARQHMGLADLEASGKLTCHVGDALEEDPTLNGRFAGILVDIFCRGGLVKRLTEETTWRVLKARLKQGAEPGRLMVNLGQSPVATEGGAIHADAVDTQLALQAMRAVFPEVAVLHIRNMDGNETQNTVALTGPFEGLQAAWESQVPVPLRVMTQAYTWQRL